MREYRQISFRFVKSQISISASRHLGISVSRLALCLSTFAFARLAKLPFFSTNAGYGGTLYDELSNQITTNLNVLQFYDKLYFSAPT
jgi:hypothetical protein